MGEASEDKRRAAMSLKFDRDLLQRFMFSSSHVSKTEQSTRYEEADDEEEELELSLGLSLGGRFGVDKTAKNKLVRSSSIAGTFPFRYDEESPSPAKAAATSYAGLMRSSSLPTESEEEWRKRKELQTLRRLAAKRRRSEKQRSTSKGEREDEVEVGPNWSRNIPVAPPFWAAVAAARKAAGADPMKGKVDILGGFQGFGLQPSSQQGSVESQGGSSSGMSELESKSLQGSSSCGEARSPASNQMLQDQRSNQDIAFGSPGNLTPESASQTSRNIGNMCKNPNPPENKEREPRMNAMEDMPCVFTVGDGPNGRKVEGILYRYGKGEEVRIMCVCHGSFLSPAEFVKHAGGSDVAHPLRHITVNPTGASFL